MFVRLANTPRDYAWGSTTAIAELLGHEPSGRPEAELWLGTHPGSPASIVNPGEVGGARTLAELVATRPEWEFGFLLKILAASHPLSLQTHPSRAQARDGFAREDAASIPLSSLARNYKDRNHKPELIVALSPTFDALCGFRTRAKIVEVLREFIAAAPSAPALETFRVAFEKHPSDEKALAWALEWLLAGSTGVQELVRECVAVSSLVASDESETVRELAGEYPGDPGIVVALLLNRVRLTRGQALFLPAGNVHAYLSGLGVEIMASSDNVLRGGLTTKHIDVAELLAVTRCEPVAVPYLAPHELAPGIELYAPAIPDFALLHVTVEEAPNGGQATVEVAGPTLLVCTVGEMFLVGAVSRITLRRGEMVFVTPDEESVQVSGTGEFFAARQGIGPASDE